MAKRPLARVQVCLYRRRGHSFRAECNVNADLVSLKLQTPGWLMMIKAGSIHLMGHIWGSRLGCENWCNDTYPTWLGACLWD